VLFQVMEQDAVSTSNSNLEGIKQVSPRWSTG
jgi:hypothetical protein